jgi:hypothetical protein
MNAIVRLKSSLTCSYCSKIYKDQVELPCGDLVCQEHLNEKNVIQTKKIKCSTCKQEFQVQNNDFKSNKSIKKQLDNHIYLNDEEISLKQKIEESFKTFFQIYDEFKSSLSKLDLDSDWYEYFLEVRRQIDLHRENLIVKIDDIYIGMIAKVEEFEKSCLKSIKENLEVSFTSFGVKSYAEDLQELEETFRDPNISIESIQKIQIQQKEKIEAIQLKLNEFTQIKEKLKASNEFKPNLSFDRDSFGQLHFKYFQFDRFKSKILTGQQPFELMKLCEFRPEDKFNLLYRASRDGFDSNDFHSKCDGHPNTLSIFKASGSSFIFGGFTSEAWESSLPGIWKSDPEAFLFSLTNKDKKPCKLKIKADKYQFAINCGSGYGPIFGMGDIQISTNPNTSKLSSSNLGKIYKHSQYIQYSNEAESFFAGSYFYQLIDFEVYQIE